MLQIADASISFAAIKSCGDRESLLICDISWHRIRERIMLPKYWPASTAAWASNLRGQHPQIFIHNIQKRLAHRMQCGLSRTTCKSLPWASFIPNSSKGIKVSPERSEIWPISALFLIICRLNNRLTLTALAQESWESLLGPCGRLPHRAMY